MAFTTKRSRKETESKSYLFLLELCVKFGSLQACSAFLKELNGKKTHEESLDFMYKTLEKHKLFQNRFKRDEKCDLMANQFKLLGNVHFAEGDYKRALKLYTRAIMGAKGQEMLAVCYANRSAVLFKLGLYEECLVDIERALSNNYPNRLKPKLVSRRAKALELKKQEPRVSFHEKAPKIPTFRRNSSFPCATNSVSIVVGDKSRKHVVATKDIQVGEVIAVETPFTAVITPFLLFHCCDCFTLCYNPIPCNSCTETVYCSETCRENAFTKYHKKECPILRSIKELIGNDSRHFHYALKMAFYAQEKHISHASKCCDRQDFVDDSTMTLMATLFYYLVETYTTALQGVGEAGVKDFKKALMSYMHICEHHISDISEVYLNDGINNELSLYKDDFAKAIYPFCGQLRHSCCPNVNGWYHGVTKVLRAVRTIKKGEECFVSYGPLYSVMGRKDRQNYLFFIYNFKCRCQACKQNWYLKEDLSAEEALVNHMLLFNNNKFHVDVAKALINRKIQLVKELEKSEPNDELIHQQTTLFNCFLVLANKRVPF